MRKVYRLVFGLVLSFVMFMAIGLEAKAESPIFYFSEYSRKYPDVQALDVNSMYEHYVTTGVAEGRYFTTPFERPTRETAAQKGTPQEIQAKLMMFDVADAIVTPWMTDAQKVMAVHDWIINHTVFDVESASAGATPPDIFSYTGVMLNGKAVCGGYAKAFDYFMQILGIQSEYIVGYATNSIGQTEGHAWNRVLIDGNWYYLDVTWDDPVSTRGDVLSHRYCMIPLADISRNHVITDVVTWMY